MATKVPAAKRKKEMLARIGRFIAPYRLTHGKGFRLRAITAEVVPNGFWPLDFGGALGKEEYERACQIGRAHV